MNPILCLFCCTLILIFFPIFSSQSGETASKTYQIGFTIPATISQNLSLNEQTVDALPKPDFQMTQEVRFDKDRGQIMVRSLVLL